MPPKELLEAYREKRRKIITQRQKEYLEEIERRKEKRRNRMPLLVVIQIR